MKQLFAIVALTGAFLVPTNTVWAACTDKHPAKDLIQKTTKKVLDALSTNAVDTESILKKEVIPNFNWKRMSRSVLGKNRQGKSKWKKATREQRARFIKAFQSLLIRTYKTSLKEAAGINFRVEYQPVCPKDIIKCRRDNKCKKIGERAKIKANIIQGGKQFAVELKTEKRKRTDYKWKAYDVKVEGMSLLANYKNEFKPLTIEAAITKMTSKNPTTQP